MGLVFQESEIVDFGGAGRPQGPGKQFQKVGGEAAHLLKGFPGPRGRPDRPNRRFPIPQKPTGHCLNPTPVGRRTVSEGGISRPPRAGPARERGRDKLRPQGATSTIHITRMFRVRVGSCRDRRGYLAVRVGSCPHEPQDHPVYPDTNTHELTRNIL